MPQPFDYSINVPDPTSSVLNALKTKYVIQQGEREQQAAELAAQQQKLLQADLAGLSQNPTAEGITQMMVKYPSLSENFKRTYDVMNSEQKKNKTNDAWQVYAALNAGDSDTATQLMETQALAAENAGNAREAKTLRDLNQLIKTSPESAMTSAGMFLANAMGPEQFTENVAKLQTARQEAQLQSGKLTEQQAKAQKAATEAQFAESQQATDLAKKGWDITKIQSDIELAKDNQKIAAMNAQLQREQNQLKREELQQKIDDKKLARDEKLRTKTVELAAARSGIDNSLSTIDRLLANPELDNILGSVEGSKFYPSTLIGLVSPVGDADKRADALADLETIQSQSFINNLQDAKAKGATFGSLTEKEGDRLIGYVKSLNTKQSEGQFKNNMKEIQRLLLKSRTNLETQYGVPKTPATEDTTTETLIQSGEIPDTPNVQVSDQELNDILAKYK